MKHNDYQSYLKQYKNDNGSSLSPGGQLTLLEPFGDLALGQPSPIDPGGLDGELLLFMYS